MDSSHVTDDVSAPANDDDDVNNPFYEAPATPSTSESSASDLRAKFHPGTVRVTQFITMGNVILLCT